jgi:hypothetical protein
MEHRKKDGKCIQKGEKRKEKGKERKRKVPRVSSNKMRKSIFYEEKNIATSKSFCMSPFSSPPSYHFKKPTAKSFEKIS